jgi:hypothetical protein
VSLHFHEPLLGVQLAFLSHTPLHLSYQPTLHLDELFRHTPLHLDALVLAHTLLGLSGPPVGLSGPPVGLSDTPVGLDALFMAYTLLSFSGTPVGLDALFMAYTLLGLSGTPVGLSDTARGRHGWVLLLITGLHAELCRVVHVASAADNSPKAWVD